MGQLTRLILEPSRQMKRVFFVLGRYLGKTIAAFFVEIEVASLDACEDRVVLENVVDADELLLDPDRVEETTGATIVHLDPVVATSEEVALRVSLNDHHLLDGLIVVIAVGMQLLVQIVDRQLVDGRFGAYEHLALITVEFDASDACALQASLPQVLILARVLREARLYKQVLFAASNEAIAVFEEADVVASDVLDPRYRTEAFHVS